jgi:hypothetical protein
MKNIIAAAALLASFIAAAEAEETTWYIGHYGVQDCVPIADFNRDRTRVYDGTGDAHLRTPDDFVRFLAASGVTLQLVKDAGTARIYQDLAGTGYLLFSDKGFCEFSMEKVRSSKP